MGWLAPLASGSRGDRKRDRSRRPLRLRADVTGHVRSSFGEARGREGACATVVTALGCVRHSMCPVARQDSHEPPLAPTVADRLKSARRRRFVGRAAELELLQGALAAAEPPFSVLWVHGPGGVGKTALLGEFAE